MSPNESNPFVTGAGSDSGAGFDPGAGSVINPYAPTAHVSDVSEHETDSERIRRKHLPHEVSIKSIGALYLLFAALMMINVVFTLVATIVNPIMRGGAVWHEESVVMLLMVALYGLIASIQFTVGRGLRRFSTTAKGVAVLFSAIGLLLFPIGTLINGYFLYLLIGKKGAYVFTKEYQDIIARTPHVQYKTSVIVKVFRLLFFLAFVALIVSALIGL